MALSNGVELFVRYEKLMTLCLQLAQERAALEEPRTTMARKEADDQVLVEELVEVHRAGARQTEVSMAPAGEGVF